MKILQVVTLITPDGAYGGPTRVALNHAAVLTRRGHAVTVVAGACGYDELPECIDGVAVRLFPARTAVRGIGYAGTAAPAMRTWIAAHASRIDIAHVHLARDLVTIPAARQLRKAGVPLVLQTHGMITPGSHPLAGPVDWVWTTRLLQQAGCVFYLNERERDDLRRVGGDGLRLEHLQNGVVAVDASVARCGLTRSHDVPEVLCMARLHKRKGAHIFAEAARTLLRAGIRARFCVVGPKEGGEVAVDAVIERARRDGVTEDQLRREPAVAPEQVLARMSKASIYALPAAREPFGMTIVEALSLAIPVVISADGGLAPFVERHGCGVVTKATPEHFASAILRLLSNPVQANAMGQRGRAAVNSELSIEQVGRRLERIYSSLLAARGDCQKC